MRKFFAAPENVSDDTIFLYGSDVNHIENVLRMQIGEEVVISDGSKNNYLATIKEFRSDCVLLSVKEKMEACRELLEDITLYQGLPKGDKMDLIIQKAVELGVKKIVPVKMHRSVVKLDEKKAKKKVDRWEKIAKGASKQSGRDVIPSISMPISMNEALTDAKKSDHIIFPYELAEGMDGACDAIDRIKVKDSISIFIGPEGGFDADEACKIREAGGITMSLGRRILRTETASLSIMAILMFDLERKEAKYNGNLS